MLFLLAMADTRALNALERVERALARIESAASRPPPPAPPSADYERLRESHDALRRRVIGAIGQLDDLIVAGERG